MKTNTQRNGTQKSSLSEQKHLSFYEENYILEPEDLEKDNGYFIYESDKEIIYLEESYQLAM